MQKKVTHRRNETRVVGEKTEKLSKKQSPPRETKRMELSEDPLHGQELEAEEEEKAVYERVTPDMYAENIRLGLEERRRQSPCCAMGCTRDLAPGEVDALLNDVRNARALGFQGWWMWVRTIYFSHLPFVSVKGEKQKKRGKRVRFFGFPSLQRHVCQVAFCALLGVHPITLFRRTRRPPAGAFPFPHGRTGQVPGNALTAAQVSSVIEFMLKVANDEAVPNPRFVFGGDEATVASVLLQLPTSYTYRSLFHRYREELRGKEQAGETVARVGWSSFWKLVKTHPDLAHIKLTKRITGMCEVCKGLRFQLQRAPDSTAGKRMGELYDHLHSATTLRRQYANRVKVAQEAQEAAGTTGCYTTVLLSFDYASQISLPVNSWETQGDWIKNTFGLSVNLFGITNDGLGRHHHYLYPEGFSHGSAHVISMLNKYFIHNPRVARAKELVVYTDSCGGQNRNKFVVAYFMTRICAGLHDRIRWNFMAVGHTKFSPDRGFALVRNEEKKHTILTMADWLAVINNIGDESSGQSFCTAEEVQAEDFRQWKSLVYPFKDFPGIKKMDIEEIVFEKARVGGVSNACRVKYKLIGKEGYTVKDMKRTTLNKELRDAGFTAVPGWPSLRDLEEDQPAALPIIPQSYRRWSELVKSIKEVIKDLPEERQSAVLEYWENIHHVDESDTESPQVSGNKRMRRTELDRTAMQASAAALAAHETPEELGDTRFLREARSVEGRRRKRSKPRK
jgi:hypothetical protein